MAENTDNYARILPYFLGPTNENETEFFFLVKQLLISHFKVRNEHAKIQPDEQASEGATSIKDILNLSELLTGPLAAANKERLRKYLALLSDELLGKSSIPFWNPKYSAHMCMDTSMPGNLGYIAALLYNANNVAVEASPITTVLEVEAGKQLCALLGYDTGPDAKIVPWGHITSGGTVANIESLWAARNLKFYPLSLRNAMRKGEPLHFLEHVLKVGPFDTATEFKPRNSESSQRLFSKLSAWELFNLRVDYILSLPQVLYTQFGVSPAFLQKAMEKHGVQTVGIRRLEEQFQLKRSKVIVSVTNHYSWPKACALTGIGRENLITIKVNEAGQMDNRELLNTLEDLGEKETSVFAVVGIVGSTEEGAVDDVDGIVELKRICSKKFGLHFAIHVDAAWGGYFASLMEENYDPETICANELRYTGLRENVNRSFLAVRKCDSVTVDPHKSGYVPYPAGALCYRNENMRYLVTFSSPYIARVNEPESIGVYGIEGSKPGAAAAAVWMSNSVIGVGGRLKHLNPKANQDIEAPNDYKTLLGTTMYSSSIFSAYWATLPQSADPFYANPENLKADLESSSNKFPRAELGGAPGGKAMIMVVPFNKISEVEDIYTGDELEKKLQEFRQYLLDNVIGRAGNEIDKDARKRLYALGSDLVINCFAVNFRLNDGNWNNNVEYANILNRLIVKRLSSVYPSQHPDKVPFFLTSTEFHQDVYGDCATKFKERLRVRGSTDLFVLRNVVMKPFVARNNFIHRLMQDFTKVAEEEAARCREWADPNGKSRHYFLLQSKASYTSEEDKSEAYLVYLPNFYLCHSSRQLILKVKTNGGFLLKKGSTLYRTESTQVDLRDAVSGTTQSRTLRLQCLDLAKSKIKKLSDIDDITNLPDSGFHTDTSELQITGILRSQSLDVSYRDTIYPTFATFYVYGDLNKLHLSHILLKAPNTFIALSNAKLDPSWDDLVVTDGKELTEGEQKIMDSRRAALQKQLNRGAILVTEIPELACQPFDITYLKRRFDDSPRQLNVTIYTDELLVDEEKHGRAVPDLLCSPRKRTWPEHESLLDYIMPPGRSPLCNGILTMGSDQDDFFIDQTWLNDDQATNWRYHNIESQSNPENAKWGWERIDRPKEQIPQPRADGEELEPTRPNGKLSEWAAYVAREVAKVEEKLKDLHIGE